MCSISHVSLPETDESEESEDGTVVRQGRMDMVSNNAHIGCGI